MSNKFMTVIYDVSQPEMKEKAKKLLSAADWTAAGWSHAFADRDEARAALYKLQESSSAAPQVVADERALPPPFFYYESNEDGSVEWNEGCVCKDDVYTNAEYAKENGTHGGKVYSEAQMRAALQAAPVQAQELSDATIINAANKYGISPHAAMPFVRELIASQSTVQEIRAVANPVEFDGIKTHAVRAQEPIGYASSNELRNLSDPGTSRLIAICASPVQPDVTVALYSAPAHPVAVPDGPYTFPIGEDGEYMILDKDGQQVGTVLYYHAAKVIAAALAAPAAQGDAIEGELTKIVKSGAEKDLPGFLEWIADRLVYVHSENNNVDYVQTLRTRAKQLRAAIAAKAES